MHCRRRICSSAPSAPRAACAQSNHERTQPLMQIHQINVAPSFGIASLNVVFVNSLNTLSSGGIYSQSGFRAFVSHRTRTPRVLDLQRKFRVSDCVLAFLLLDP